MIDNVLELCEGLCFINKKNETLLGDKIVLYAHHTNNNIITRSVKAQLDNWNKLNWKIVIVDSSNNVLPWPEYIHTVIQKPNIGSDCGSLAVGLHLVPEIKNAKKVLMATNAFVGPFYPFDELLKKFENSSADFWGVTSSTEINWHIQTYWFGFSNGLLKNPVMENYWKSARHVQNRTDYVYLHEIALSKLVIENNWSREVVFSYENTAGVVGSDLGLTSWDKLLDAGRPFVRKRYLHGFIDKEKLINKISEYGEEALKMLEEAYEETLSG